MGEVNAPRHDAMMTYSSVDEDVEVSSPEMVFSLPQELKEKVCRPWKTSIILKVMGPQMAYSILLCRLKDYGNLKVLSSSLILAMTFT